MNHSNKFILFLIIDLFVAFITPVFFGGNVIRVLSSNSFWYIPLFVVLLGVLFGYFISLVANKSNEGQAYFWGQIISAIVFSCFLVAQGYQDWKYRNYERNIEDNHNVMSYQVDDHELYIRTAFNKLEATFTNPNDFKLQSFHVHKQNIVVNYKPDTIFTIYFTYFLNDDAHERLSKLTVFQNEAQIWLKHSLVDTTTEYHLVRKEFREELQSN